MCNKYALKSPCNNCPFVRGNPFAERKTLSQDRIEDIVNDTVLGDDYFSCHKTTHGRADSEMMCAGHLILAEKINPMGNIVHRMAAMMSVFDPQALNMGADVYDTAEEMINAYAPDGDDWFGVRMD